MHKKNIFRDVSHRLTMGRREEPKKRINTLKYTRIHMRKTFLTNFQNRMTNQCSNAQRPDGVQFGAVQSLWRRGALGGQGDLKLKKRLISRIIPRFGRKFFCAGRKSYFRGWLIGKIEYECTLALTPSPLPRGEGETDSVVDCSVVHGVIDARRYAERGGQGRGTAVRLVIGPKPIKYIESGY